MFRSLLTASAFLVTACVGLAGEPQLGSEVRVVPSPVGSGPEDTTYEIRAGSCRIRWTVSRFGADQGIAQHRAECTLPLSEQIALNAALLDKVLESEPTFRMLFLGRLDPFPEISIRLAAAAKHSSGWDSRRGKPRSSKPMDGYLLGLLSSSESVVFAEWKRLFEEKRLTFAVAGVESVTVEAAGTVPHFPQLSARGVMADDRLPLDCLIWLSATRRQ
jgi:hypothetical protein